MVVKVEKFKQIHHLKHKLEMNLQDHLPFGTFECGFDDNTYELIYRTFYF